MLSAVFIFLISFVSCINGYNNELPEGSTCIRAFNEMEGKCVNYFRCPEVIVDTSWAGESGKPTICSFDGLVPIICCTSCNLVRNITDAVVTRTGDLYWKTGSKSWDSCIEYSSKLPYRCKKTAGLGYNFDLDRKCYNVTTVAPLVYGGRNALQFEFPHMALLGYGKEPEGIQWLCGGSILSARFVLTAAHCTSYSRAVVSHVAAGILRRSDEAADGRQTRLVTRVVSHPEYRSPDKYHDIALLQTDKPFEFNKYVLPACLQSALLDAGRLRQEENEFLATGWGALRPNGKLAEDLQVGDSGGPLQYFSSSTCSHVVVGVTSYGRPCGFPGGAGMYTRVQHYIPWIESFVWP